MSIIEIIISSFPKLLIPGLLYTIPLTIASFIIGLAIAIIVAIVQIYNIKFFKTLCRLYVWIFRGTPLMVQLFIIFYGLPNVGILIDAVPAAIIAFSLNVGAYASETLRGSILSVPVGQVEACLSVGMTNLQSMYHVIIPQAIKISVPALFNTFISLIKDTSLAANITITEMFMVTQRIVAVTYEPLVLYIEVAFIYLIFCTALTWLQHYVEKKMSFNKEAL